MVGVEGCESTSIPDTVGVGVDFGRIETGTEKDMTIFCSGPEPLVVDIQRYIVGNIGVADPSSPISSPSASKATGVGRSSAVARALRLPLGRDCFLRSRFIVSAYHEYGRISTSHTYASESALLFRPLVSFQRGSCVCVLSPLF